MITNNGIIIRTAVSEINVHSRYSSGVRVMRLGGDAEVVTFARAPQEEMDEEVADDADSADNNENIADEE